MKIVIIGNGKIGSNLAAVLVREGHDVTVVDCEEAHLRKSQNTLDVMCIEGNGATAEETYNQISLQIVTTFFPLYTHIWYPTTELSTKVVR